MKLLNKAAILQASDLKHEDVEVPAWGGTVRVREMSGAERDEYYSVVSKFDQVPPAKFSALLLAVTCVDEEGNRVFSIDDIDALEAKNPRSVDIPAAVALRINKMDANAVKEAEKNSASDQSDDSGSDSPKS